MRRRGDAEVRSNVTGFGKELSRDMTKPTKWVCAQRRPRSAWTSAQSDQSSLSAWRNLRSLATHWAHNEDSDQTVWMPRLIWVFAGRTVTLWVLSCCGSLTGLFGGAMGGTRHFQNYWGWAWGLASAVQCYVLWKHVLIAIELNIKSNRHINLLDLHTVC